MRPLYTWLTCMSVYGAQSSYDPRFMRELLPGADTYRMGALAKLFDVNLNNLDQLPEEKYKLFEECSPITHLTKDDPPVQLIYGTPMDDTGIHSPRFGFGKANVKVGEKSVSVQIGMNLTIVGSKELPK